MFSQTQETYPLLILGHSLSIRHIFTSYFLCIRSYRSISLFLIQLMSTNSIPGVALEHCVGWTLVRYKFMTRHNKMEGIMYLCLHWDKTRRNMQICGYVILSVRVWIRENKHTVMHNRYWFFCSVKTWNLNEEIWNETRYRHTDMIFK